MVHFKYYVCVIYVINAHTLDNFNCIRTSSDELLHKVEKLFTEVQPFITTFVLSS